MFNLARFQKRIDSFPEEYKYNYDEFWEWKVEVESPNGCSILDYKHKVETYHKLCEVLPKWQTYRPLDNTPCLRTLKASLNNIAKVYDRLRKYTLLDFEQIPRQLLSPVWQELGRAKEEKGQTNDYGSYAIIAACKPLLFLWGQTLAFDSRVRGNLPERYEIDKNSRSWDVDEWMRIMKLISEDLKRDKKAIKFIEEKSAEWYGKEAIVPYGRLLDIYYFEGN